MIEELHCLFVLVVCVGCLCWLCWLLALPLGVMATIGLAKRFRAPRIAIAGATGAVGQEFLRVLSERKFPMSSLKLLASSRSVGRKLPYQDQLLPVSELTEDSFRDVDIALFSAGGSQSKRYV